jgi:hypothetical protein
MEKERPDEMEVAEKENEKRKEKEGQEVIRLGLEGKKNGYKKHRCQKEKESMVKHIFSRMDGQSIIRRKQCL